VKRRYCIAVRASGGTTLALPHEPDLIEEQLDLVDGVLIPGGGFQFPDPEIFAPDRPPDAPPEKVERARFELALARRALERDLPLLGICGGEQILNAATGGTLAVRMEEACDHPLPHLIPPMQSAPHEVRLVDGTQLRAAVGRESQEVNSLHRQAVAKTGPGVAVNAIAPDGVIEGVEVSERRFCIGVQWHPEYFGCPGDQLLFEAFVAAAAEVARAAARPRVGDRNPNPERTSHG
jgi:putative glutamine amidotransferase